MVLDESVILIRLILEDSGGGLPIARRNLTIDSDYLMLPRDQVNVLILRDAWVDQFIVTDHDLHSARESCLAT